jgi:hypothetical protein
MTGAPSSGRTCIAYYVSGLPSLKKNKGVHVGRMASKANGAFTIATKRGTVTDIGYRYCTRLQRNDGYGYLTAGKEERSFLPVFQ